MILCDIRGALFCLLTVLVITNACAVSTNVAVQDTIKFEEHKNDFPKKLKNLRKWDAPTIADLDSDGYPDLLLNDHGFGIRVCWNNKGKFADPYDIIMGDLHGMTVGDIDGDGQLELLMSRGGGSGSNARNSKIYRVGPDRSFVELKGLNEPLALMRGRTLKLVDGDNDGDLDLLNFAFPDKGMFPKSENYIYSNEGEGVFKLATTLPPVKTDGQKTLVTDFNGDNILDLLVYGNGNGNLKAYKGSAEFSYKEVTDDLNLSGIKNVTGIVEFDFDNDGDQDIYITRGLDFEAGETFYNPDSKTWGFYTKRGAFSFDDLELGDILNIENYQSQWPNKTLYLGETGYEYEFPGETHSGRDIRIVNSDALGFPDEVAKKGITIGYIGNKKWRVAGDIWSPTTGVIHGVNSYPISDHKTGLKDLLLMNVGGKFKDVSQDYNVDLEEHTTSVATADLDNNGFADLIINRRGDLIHPNQAIVYLNRGKKGFALLEDHGIISQELGAIGLGIETLDYDLDGKMDVVIGNERGKWHLFKNSSFTKQKNRFTRIKVGYSPTGKSTSLGAVVTLLSGSYHQSKRIGSTGAMYSLNANDHVHFGIPISNQTFSIKVEWSNGEVVEQDLGEFNTQIVIGKKSP